MRRLQIALFTILALVLGIAVVAAQEGTPATAEHPFVGTWLLDTDADDPDNAPEVLVITADGAYISVDAEGVPSLGVWEATGDRSATVTLTLPGVNEDGSFAGTFMVRASVEVDPAGDTFTAQYTGEVVGPDGVSTGEFGPGTATATRLAPEAMGTPEGALDELFELFEGTPEAATPEG